MMSRDNFLTGFIPGLLLPLLVGAAYYFYQFGLDSSSDYFKIFSQREILSPLLAIGCFFNLVIFFLFIRIYLERSARGVVTATILYGLAIVLMKVM